MPVKVTIALGRRDDGGLFIYSGDVPGLVLSYKEPSKVLAAVVPAVEVLLFAPGWSSDARARCH